MLVYADITQIKMIRGTYDASVCLYQVSMELSQPQESSFENFIENLENGPNVHWSVGSGA